MESEPNPYQPPAEASVDDSDSALSADIDFPRGLLSPLWIALGGASIEALLINLPRFLGSRLGSLPLMLMLVVWCTSFAWIARLLPGTQAERSKRALISVLLSFPALILYIPVCGFVATSTGGDLLYDATPLSITLGTVVAFVSIVFLFALRVRHVVRVAHRNQ